MKQIWIFFGEMGAGKTYLGQICAERRNFKFFDGDTAMTSTMKLFVEEFKPLPRYVIQRFVKRLAIIIANQARKSGWLNKDGLVVAQALYFKEDREYLTKYLKDLGYDVSWFYVYKSFWKNFWQLFCRKDGFKWVLYWLFSRPYFQKPQLGSCNFVGEGCEDLV